MYFLSFIITTFSIFFSFPYTLPAMEKSIEYDSLHPSYLSTSDASLKKPDVVRRSPSPIDIYFNPDVDMHRLEATVPNPLLIIEDEAQTARVGRRTATVLGYTPIVVSSIEHAQRVVIYCSNRDIRLKLCTDNSLPDGKGLTLIDWLRENYSFIPAVMHSGDDIGKQCEEREVPFFSKPNWPAALKALQELNMGRFKID